MRVEKKTFFSLSKLFRVFDVDLMISAENSLCEVESTWAKLLKFFIKIPASVAT